MRRLAILGAGDLGQLIAHHAGICGYEMVGFFDDFAQIDDVVDAYTVLGSISNIEEHFQKKHFDCLFIAIGYKHFDFRKKMFEKFEKQIDMATLLHPSCYVDVSCKIGRGVCLLPGSILDRNVEIGDNVLVNVGCTIAHDTYIGSHSFLSPDVSLAGFVRIGASCNLGIGTIVIDSITIDSTVQTGAGTVVIQDIKSPGLYVGNPSRFIR